MAGIDGGGGSMDFEYNSQPMSGLQADPIRTGGRISRCPALMHSSWSSFSAASYHGPPTHVGWQQGPYHTNHLTGYNPHHMSSDYATHLAARTPSLPNHLPEPRGSHLPRPQETAIPAPAVYNPTRYATGVALLDPSPPATTASSPGATSASPTSAPDHQVSPFSRLSPPHIRAQTIPAAENPGLDAYSVPSPPALASATQAQSSSFSPAQNEDQSSSARPPHPHSTARVRLPAPGHSRQRLPPNDRRLTMTLGHYARYRDVADYFEVTEYDASHAPASQTSDDDSDRDFGSRPYASAGHAYLQSARQTQILRGQMNNKRVASKKAIQSLQKVDVDSLSDTEKTCVICYNDFDVASPEGTVETPLRLPKCKHVFGNQCILKWLEESNSCPYCRDKLESEMARPDQDTIRRMLSEAELAHVPPSLRHRLYRTQTSDRAEARAEAQSLLRARQRELEANRDSISRGERRAAPPEDSSDAQRRQRPRFSADGLNSATTMTSTQNHSSAHRAPAWQHGPALVNPWATSTHYPGGGPSPPGHLANYALPSFATANPGLPHEMSGPNFPPMFSREDYYNGPQGSELAQMGFDVSRPGATHAYTLPRPLHAFSRHMHSPGDSFHYATHQQHNQQPSPYPNMAQPVRSDGPTQGGAYPNRN